MADRFVGLARDRDGVDARSVSGAIDRLLRVWQETGDDDSFSRLVSIARPIAIRIGAAELRRHGIRDPSAIDDVLSRVLDHLRRLPRFTPGRPVAAYRQPDSPGVDDGHRYLAWLARRRALDVIRSWRRQSRSMPCFSSIMVEADRERLERGAATPDPNDAPACEEQAAMFHAALAGLSPRLRAVIELLLEGKTQAVVAHVLEVSEGTVSRLRHRAIAELRRALEP